MAFYVSLLGYRPFKLNREISPRFEGCDTAISGANPPSPPISKVRAILWRASWNAGVAVRYLRNEVNTNKF